MPEKDTNPYQGKRVLIMAGGTGGHVIPALSLASEFRKRGLTVEWLGSPNGIENRLVPAADIPLNHVQVAGLRGKGIRRKLSAPWLIIRSVWQAISVLRRYKPDLVIGLGGFASGPGGLAAWIMRVPLFIHEQNAVAGMTNRWLNRFARKTFAAFPGAFAEDKAVVSGNPVRNELFDIAPVCTENERYHLLVVGGSLGAQAINDCLPEALSSIPEHQRPVVRHQSGKGKKDRTCQAYQAVNIDSDVTEFIDDMHQAYSWADLVLCRAGALTVSELAAAGRASVLVPLPIAVDDHQTANARFLVHEKAAVLMPQKEMNASTLAKVLTDLSADKKQLKQMGLNARKAAQPRATSQVVDECLEICFD
ncbi:undecaprenyldiphospho-muramoylpentapeptide beta-N-acetylglucosaminyltransferase [Oceanospirillum sediminis]|uniref:UDP-N-acetylglucosamine--N-acetylmuramyl-(pentapeptide) pyrophosphoryl-undecaprenol N-acetylglucosamine transferase n=1 Tax=Oceanospirillum sediminis TaxID=2760088 RepID=A0A839IKS8_9GAMM|nr:undecaprenyldiphospho-muramoylpentapeptide beta-N-acetylglucosaminyltransferase [Oceanospirillum sediminis]MBB1485481.1 undecaprenyldiphospho-muramoylpentapeptide beta-N-acetylglucosaminyltransferase [Oceanospirillum sediminis]